MPQASDYQFEHLPAPRTEQREPDASVPERDAAVASLVSRPGDLDAILRRADNATVIRVFAHLQRAIGNREVCGAIGALAPVQRRSDDELIGAVPRQEPLPGASKGTGGPEAGGAEQRTGRTPGPRAVTKAREPEVQRPGRKSPPGAGKPGRVTAGPAATVPGGEGLAELELPAELEAGASGPKTTATPPADTTVPGAGTPGASPAAAILEDLQRLDDESSAALQQALGEIHSASRSIRARAGAEMAQREVRLDATYAQQRSLLQARVEAAIASVGARRAAEQQAIRASARQQRQRLAQAATGERQGAGAYVAQVGGEVRAAGRREGARARGESARRAAQIRAAGAAAPAGGDAALADAQRTSNRKIGDKAARECLETGKQLAGSVEAEAAQHATRSYGELRAGFDSQIAKTSREGDQGITRFASQALARADELARGAIAVINQLGEGSFAALDRQRQAGKRQLARWKQQVGHGLDVLIPRLRAPLEQGRAAAHADLRAYVTNATLALAATTDEGEAAGQADALHVALAQARGRLIDGPRRTGASSTGRLSRALEGPLRGLESLTTHLMQAATETGMDLVGKVSAAAADADAGLARSTVAFGQQVGAAVDTAVADVARAGQRFRSEVDAPHRQLLQKLSQLVDDGLASEDRTIAEAREKMGSTTGQIASRFEQLKGEAERRNATERSVSRMIVQRGLWGRIKRAVGGFIDSVRNWLTKTFGEFWGGLLFGVLAALVIVAVGVLASYVVGAIVGAIIATAKIAAIVTAVILIVGAVALGIYNRFQEFYADNPGKKPSFWQALGLVGLGVADLTGIPFIIEGAVGQRAFGRKLSDSERGERIGMGVVFLFTAGLAAYKGIPALLRGRAGKGGPRVDSGPRPGEVGAPERPQPRPAEATPAGMSPKLQSSRAGLSDPRAIEQFDIMFERMGRDSGKMERVIDGLTTKGGLQERLIADWERAHPAPRTPRGEALGQVEPLKARAEALRDQVQAFLDANPQVGERSWLKALRGEIERLEGMRTGEIEASVDGVQGTRNNINGVEAEFNAARAETGVTGIGRKFSLDGQPNRVEVDIVADGGRRWIDVKRVEPFGLDSTDWKGGSGKQGLSTQASEMVRAASQNPVNGAPPKVVFDFPRGVTREVVDALRAMGIEVRGNIVEPPPRPIPVAVPRENGEEEPER